MLRRNIIFKTDPNQRDMTDKFKMDMKKPQNRRGPYTKINQILTRYFEFDFQFKNG